MSTSTRAAAAGEPIAKTGMMAKKGGIRHNWLTRYFTLFNGALCYYPSPEDKVPKGYILTKDVTEVRPKSNEKVGKKANKGDYCFEVVTAKRTYYFSPDTKEDMDAWIEAIRSWIGKKEEAPTKAVPDPRKSVKTDGETKKPDETKHAVAAAGTTPAPAAEATPTTTPAAGTEGKGEPTSPRGDDDGKDDEKPQKYEAQYDYDAQEDNELSFKEGDTVNVLDTFKGAGWWKAELNGKVGLIPGNFFTKK